MRVGKPNWERILRCDRCGAEATDESINPVMAILAEGSWAVRWEPPEAHLCPDCVTPADLREGYERAA